MDGSDESELSADFGNAELTEKIGTVRGARQGDFLKVTKGGGKSK